jgi:hypothetical protein
MRGIKQHTRTLTLGLALGLALPGVARAVEETNYARNAIVVARPAPDWALESLAGTVDGSRERIAGNVTGWSGWTPCEVEFWFARAAAVPVSKVKVFLGAETWAPAIRYKGEIQARDGQVWRTLKEFEQACAWNAPVVWEGQEIVTSGLRLVVKESDWRIGGGGGREVYVYEVEAFGPQRSVPALDASADLAIEPQGAADPEPFVNGKVFRLGEKSRFVVKLAAGAGRPAGRYALRCEIRDGQLNLLETLPEQTVSAEEAARKTFTWRPKAQGPYFVEVSLLKDGALAGLKRELFGVRDDRLFAEGRIEPLPALSGQRQDKPSATAPGHVPFSLGDFSGTLSQPVKKRSVELAREAGFDLYKIWQKWQDLEPLPGVYSFKQLDDVFAYAGEAGIGVGITLVLSGDGAPSWMQGEFALHQNGTKHGSFIRGYSYGLSNHGEKNRAHRARLAQLLATRYGGHPLLAYWQPNPADTEAGIVESPSSRKDYSRWAARGFREFLREFKGWTLEQVNKRWGTDYGAWEDIQAPRPAFELTGNHVNAMAIDVRPMWLDWMEYREWSHTAAVKSVVEPLRAASPDVPMSLWSDLGSGEAYYLPYLSEVRCGVAHCAMGSGNGNQMMKQAMFARRWGVPYRNEYHLLSPISAQHWDGGIYDQLAMEARFFDWIGGIPNSRKPVQPYVAAFHKSGRVNELLDELSLGRRPLGQVGYLWSPLASQLQGKGGNYYVDAETWTRMMTVGNWAQTAHQWVEPFAWGGPLKDLEQCRAVLVEAAQVIPEGDSQQMADYVRRGGKVVLPWMTGRYARPATGEQVSPEIPTQEAKWLGLTYNVLQPTYPLLSALGYGGVKELPSPAAWEWHEARHGELELTGEHPALRGLEKAKVSFVVALDPASAPGSRVLATVNGKPAALAWPLGQGEVVLLGFMLGDIPTEDSTMAAAGWFDKARTDEVGAASRQAYDELKRQMAQVLGNLHDWTGTPANLKGPEAVRGHYGRNGDTHYAMLMNFTGEQWKAELKQTGTVWKFPSLPDGDYEVTLMRLAGDESLGARGAAELREKGITLDFGPQEFIAIRLKPRG